MLFILTGDIQTGKTRWLEKLVEGLTANDIRVEGVIAPGVWREREDAPAGTRPAERFEKLGIDNVLLPDGLRISFAMRRDLAESNPEAAPRHASESARAHLGWTISDEAIAQVNGHFAQLRAVGRTQGSDSAAPCLLVVDELGRLELECGGGLTEAVALLGDGPRNPSCHALAVARSSLAEAVEERFGCIWGQTRRIAPDDEARALVRSLWGMTPTRQDANGMQETIQKQQKDSPFCCFWAASGGRTEHDDA